MDTKHADALKALAARLHGELHDDALHRSIYATDASAYQETPLAVANAKSVEDPGTEGIHVPVKFAYFHKGRSHQFEADPTVTGYIIGSSKAEKLIREKNFEEALAIYTALVEDERSTPLQESFELKQAARCARGLKDDDLAKELEARISK
ncbi:hypothetical protein N9060_02175 [Arenicella sp.]|nr:hypothetical protein [Arenicella sp.]